ncbi:TonB-dependent receptor [Pontibacter sp. SGAir0037]|uniref:SusC/RagA family TonB-linked outer membrane protein n=1 Tax=Pontibacter sp. SGAir0037 TaxID=2571030 RepID=UPI00143D22D2|nr:TonB-dependent receptor [Pontibacter sp. SGAir0037]
MLKGKVLGADGPIPGATVRVDGTTTGTATAADGSFSINCDPAATLVVSAIGYNLKKVAVNNQPSLEITLGEDLQLLNEVVVTAYGTANKSTYTGAASVVSGEDIQKIQSSNISQSLQGMSTGVQVLNANGQPGSDGTIIIRGLSSIRSNNNPLIVVDGMPYSGALSSISPNDVESMTVLKDAASTALYGSRAANGVIVITTKKGSVAKPAINFRSNFGYSDMAVPFPDKVNATQLFELAWEALKNGQMDQGVSEADAAKWASDNVVSKYFQNPEKNVFNTAYPIGLDGKLKPGVEQLYNGDWIGELYSPAFRQEYTLDFSGSTGQNNKTQYYLSGSYLNDKGNFAVQKFERYSARLNVSSDIKDWLNVGTNLFFAHSFQEYPSAETRFLRVMPVVYPVYEWDYENNRYKTDSYGNRLPDFGDYSRTEWRGWNNAFVGSYKNEYDWNFSGNRTDNLSTRSFLEIKLLPDLKLRSGISTDFGLYYNHSYQSATVSYSAGYGGWASRTANRTFSFTLNNILTYDKTFGQHHINVLAGQETYNYKYNGLSASREGFPLGGLYEMSAAARITGASSSEDNYRLMSYLSRAEYDFGQRYFISASLRTDGSSRFHPNNRWGKFWSIGASWRMSEEAFMKDITWIDNLKIRGSYGSVGNDNVGYYAYQGLYATGYNDYANPGALLSRLPTPDLIWESNIQANVGVDFHLFKLIDASVDVFDRRSNDLIFYRPLPPSTGVGGIDENIGDIRNYGYEVQLTTDIINANDFRWNINLNASKYKNEITRLPQDEIYNGRYKYTKGVSMYEFFGPVWAGVDPATGDNTWWKFTENGQERTFDYSEVNKTDQMRYLGTSIPDLLGAVTNNFSYKGLDFSVMLYYSLGGKMYDTDYAEGVRWRRGFNMSTQILDRWTPENRETNIPRLSEFTQNNITVYSSQYLFNNTFMRLRNVNIGYTLPASLTSKIGVNSLRLYASGDNLLTWGEAARRGTDPETAINGYVGNGANGSAAAPIRKNYSFGVQLSF